MAKNYSVSINLQSVDYTGALASGTCYTAANAGSFGRNHFNITPTVNMALNDDNVLSFSWGGYTGSSVWYVCSVHGYHLDVQFSTDNRNWSTIASAFVNENRTQTCDGTYHAWEMVRDLTNSLKSTQLTQPGYLRLITWTEQACPTTALPNAYPNQVASEAVAAEIHIDVEVDYRPGSTYNGSTFMSHNRSGGVCNVYTGSWTEAKTKDYPTGRGDPPEAYRDGGWYNMAKIGQE